MYRHQINSPVYTTPVYYPSQLLVLKSIMSVPRSGGNRAGDRLVRKGEDGEGFQTAGKRKEESSQEIRYEG